MTLVGLMADLRDALRSGDLGAMEEIAIGIETALPEARTLQRPELEMLVRMSAENARGLAAARQGVRSARRRLAEIAAAERGLTYDRNGTRSSFLPGATGLRF